MLAAAPASCAVELPAEVAATQSVCVGGEASLASVTVPASVPGVVSYSLLPDPDVPPGSYDVSEGAVTVTVTAMLAEGYVFAGRRVDWGSTDEPGTATYDGAVGGGAGVVCGGVAAGGGGDAVGV